MLEEENDNRSSSQSIEKDNIWITPNHTLMNQGDLGRFSKAEREICRSTRSFDAPPFFFWLPFHPCIVSDKLF